MKVFITACFITLLSSFGIAQEVRTDNTATLNPTGCATLLPTQPFVICDEITTTITPVVHTTGTASINYSWAVPPFSNILGSTYNMQLVTYNGGVYTVTASNADNGCTTMQTYTVVVCADVGIEENMANSAVISVYPNPCVDALRLELRSGATASLFNSLGAVVLTKTCDAGVNSIDVSGLAKGLYYLRVGKSAYGKVIKE